MKFPASHVGSGDVIVFIRGETLSAHSACPRKDAIRCKMKPQKITAKPQHGSVTT